MKKTTTIAILLLLIASPVFAKKYQSSFGFSVEIPSHWLVVTRQEMKDNQDLLDLLNEYFDNHNKDLSKVIMQKVRSGGVEVWFNTLTSDIQFGDNVNIYKTFGAIPKNENDLPSFSKLSSEYSKVAGRHINFYTCELREINGLNTMYLEFDGRREGTKCIQYLIQKSNSVQIHITATCKKSVFDTIREEFNNIISSLRLTDARKNLDPQKACEANCENMFENRELKPGMTVEECIKILCK